MRRIENVKDREGIKFCAKAVSKDDTRYNLQGLYYDKDWGLMLGCDGHRLHAYQPEEEFETGYYDVLVNKKKELVIGKDPQEQGREFPNWEPIFPHVKGEGMALKSARGKGDSFAAYTQIVRSMTRGDLTFNYAYVQDVLGENEYWDFWKKYEDGTALFVNHIKFALVMPCRM